MIDADILIQQTEDIFFELANENLSDEKLSLLLANQSALFIEINDTISQSWPELLYEEVDNEEYIELAVFLDLNDKVERLALMLIGMDLENDKECHIQW